MNVQQHILVVEDNPGDFILIEDFILAQFTSPLIKNVSSFKEAEAILAREGHGFNIVLLDLSLPDHGGEQLIQDILQLCKHLPVIVLTGYANQDFGVKSLNMGISDYLLKDDLNAVALYKSIIYSIERKKISSELEESEKRVRNFANQLSAVLEQERQHIAREIHDEFGQQLAGLKMSLSALKRQNGSPDEQVNRIDALIEDVNGSIAMVRRIANELRPAIIDQLGLFSALEWLVKEFEKKTGIQCTMHLTAMQDNLSKDVAINVFRICQEALTNIAKHARASKVKVIIAPVPHGFAITITDDGIGMASDSLDKPLSMGLLNMKERSQLINATLQIESKLNEGCSIHLILTTDDQDINS